MKLKVLLLAAKRSHLPIGNSPRQDPQRGSRYLHLFRIFNLVFNAIAD